MLYWQFSLCDVKVFAKMFFYREIRSPGFEFLHQEAWTKWTLFPMQHWLPCCPLQVTHASRPCFTTPIHFPTSIPCFTSPLHVPTSHLRFMPQLHFPASLPCFTSPLHFPASLPHFTSCFTSPPCFPASLPCFTFPTCFPASLPASLPHHIQYPRAWKIWILACPSDKQLSNVCLPGADLRTWLFLYYLIGRELDWALTH